MESALHAVIDAGSSGTRLFLYEVKPGAYPLISAMAEVENSNMANGMREDGINNFVDPQRPSKQSEVLQETIYPLLNRIRSLVDRYGATTDEVTVDLFATAGMRYAEKLYGDEAINKFYDIIRQGVSASGFKVGQVRTCDGFSEEGIW